MSATPLLDVDLMCQVGAFSLRATFAAERGPVVLLGPSGAGKTLTLKCIAGIVEPDAGTISINGRVVFDEAKRVRLHPQARRVGYVPQQYALFPHLTVAKNVAFGLGGLSASERRARVDQMLELVGLVEQRALKPGQLSGGQRQRVAVGRALVTQPEILLLDEPFAALDPLLRNELSDSLVEVAAAMGAAILMVTHDRAEALRLGDRIAVLMDGRVRQVGSPADVFGSPVDEDVAQFVGVETIVSGRVLSLDEGVALVDVGGRAIEGGGETAEVGDDVLVCLRPEDVSLSEPGGESAPTSARNRVAGRVTRIVPSGPFLRVEVDAGFPLVALITKQSREDLGIESGAEVVATFKASAVHLIRKRAG